MEKTKIKSETKYSKNQINKAGEQILTVDNNTEEFKYYKTIIDSWSSLHFKPMGTIYSKLQRDSQNIKNVVVAQRLKRFDSIYSKLEKNKNMNLSRMQDLGGCRVILNNCDEVYMFADKYKNSRIRHSLVKTFDYINKPKSSGYRSLHHVYSYKSDNKSELNGLLIEVQYRTRLQHLWATAVESVSIYTNQPLKRDIGDLKIKRFFYIVSSIFSIEEKQNLHDKSPTDIIELKKELNNILKEINILAILSAIKVALENKKEELQFRKRGYYLLNLNMVTRMLNIKYFNNGDYEQQWKYITFYKVKVSKIKKIVY